MLLYGILIKTGEPKLKFVILVFLLSFATTFANDEIYISRDAKHKLMPVVGKIDFKKEQLGYNYHYTFVNFRDSSEVEINRSDVMEQSPSTSLLGISYTYSFNASFKADVSVSAILNQQTVRYPIYYQAFNYDNRSHVTIDYNNTIMTNLDAGYKLPFRLNWCDAYVIGGLGYAKRSARVTTRYDWETAEAIMADKQLVLRGGMSFDVVSEKNFYGKLSVMFIQFSPMDSDLDAYNGFMWNIGIFPLWSGSVQ